VHFSQVFEVYVIMIHKENAEFRIVLSKYCILEVSQAMRQHTQTYQVCSCIE